MGTTQNLVCMVDPTAENGIIDYMSRATGVKYSEEQLNILKMHGGMCILASAGSGKTTTLNHLIAKRIQTGEIGDPSKLLCTTFSKAGADEMGQRLGQLLSQLGIRKSVTVRTLHSIYFSLLKDMQYKLNVVDSGVKMGYIRDACKENNVQLEDDEFQTLDSILSYQINNLMSDADVFQSYIYTLREKIPLEVYSSIRNGFNRRKQTAGVLDFDDMQLMVYQIFRSETYGEPLKKYCNSLWEYIYIDEAQDISKIQFAILKKLVSDPSKLVIIGDDDQCIYQWRGADPSIILNICGIYPELTRVTLTTNYRCLSNIVDRASHGIKFNVVRSDKNMVAHDVGGDIKFCDTGDCNFYEMSKYAYEYIHKLVIEDGVLPSDIAVLARNNQHLTILGNMLFKSGIFCRQADEIKFTKVNIFKIINSAFKLGENTTNGNITGDNIWKYCSYMSRKVSREIGKIQVAYGLSLYDTLGLILTNFCTIDVKWKNPGVKIGSFDYGKYSQLMSTLSRETIDSIVTIYNLLSTNDRTKIVTGLLVMFVNTKIAFFYKSEFASRFAEGYIMYLIDLINNMGYNNFSRYIKTVEQFESGKMAVMSPMVTLSTMHGAKGKEWKYVLIFADDNISFPSFENINSCIESGVPEIDIRRMIAEDRRLHYVAITRAKEHLVIFADKQNLSLYTLESFGIMDYGKSNDTHIIMMAQQGEYDGLKAEGSKLFNSDSEYGLVVNIHNDSSNVEDTKEEDNETINISSIQTFAPLSIPDDDD